MAEVVSKPKQRMSPQMIIGLIAGLYGISPIDVIPDFIPLVGWADDGGVIVLALALMLVVTVLGAGKGAE